METNQIIDRVRQKRSEGVYGRSKILTDFPYLTLVQVRKIIAAADNGTNPDNIENVKTVKKPSVMGKGISSMELRAKYDTKYIVHTKVRKLEKDVFLTDSEFRIFCNFTGGYKDTVENSQFSKYRGKAGSVIYWSHPESIKQMVDEGVLKEIS